VVHLRQCLKTMGERAMTPDLARSLFSVTRLLVGNVVLGAGRGVDIGDAPDP
jgi:hypothetical protein